MVHVKGHAVGNLFGPRHWIWIATYGGRTALPTVITSKRVRIERGILSKVKESVELFQIDHFDVLKPLGMRIAGQCILHLPSSDAGFPSMRFCGAPELGKLGDQLRELSLRERTRRKVTTLVQA
jgi:hypothetical protein